MTHGSFLNHLLAGVGGVAAAALAFAAVLIAKSARDFSQTGPKLAEEISRHYKRYTVFAVARLAFWAFVLLFLMGSVGLVAYACMVQLGVLAFSPAGTVLAATSGIVALTGLQFARHLLYLPASIIASLHYLPSRLYPLWRFLSPSRLRALQSALLGAFLLLVLAAAVNMLSDRDWLSFLALSGLVPASAALLAWAAQPRELQPKESRPRGHEGKPNIIMIGSDTLRADRLGCAGYPRSLTPVLDGLATKGTQFTQCYVPCARTAPSLISLLTGSWPHTHGIRDNFVGDDETTLPVPALPAILAECGYQTAAVGDWAATDMGKFNLGFQTLDIPEDQWNIKYLIRQGPKDLRLFLSLFTHNRFGKRFLPELYYLAGVPLTSKVGRDARAMISRLASDGQPFFLNVFMATTHPPFGSEHPYYTLFSDPDYRGESKFVMARLTDPFEIIRRQGDSKKEFDLDQILNLYDGCVRNFDDEVARILQHIRTTGLDDNTIVVVYSDHGMEFFEHETWGQGNSVVGDFSPKVPLIIFDPRRESGRRVDDIVRSVDVAPTLLDLAGVPKPPHLDGVSLAPYLGDASAALGLPAFAETGIWLAELPGMTKDHLRYPDLIELLEVKDKRSGTLSIKREYQPAIIAAKDRMIRSGRWKLVYQPLSQGHRLMLFDLETDPECKRDVASQRPEIAGELWQVLRAWITSAGPAADRRPDRNGTTD
ncbi:MAG: sulfatase [Pseudomonadota bacterium]